MGYSNLQADDGNSYLRFECVLEGFTADGIAHFCIEIIGTIGKSLHLMFFCMIYYFSFIHTLAKMACTDDLWANSVNYYLLQTKNVRNFYFYISIFSIIWLPTKTNI